MKKLNLLLTAILAGSIAASSSASAAVILFLDTTAKTYEFVGTTNVGSASEVIPGSAYTVSWSLTPPGGAATPDNQDLSGYFTTTVGGPSLFLLSSFDVFTNSVTVSLNFDSEGPMTITFAQGANPTLSYASWSAANIALLESVIGSEMVLSQGTGFGNISIQAIPEPTSLALLGLGVSGFIARRRRNIG